MNKHGLPRTFTLMIPALILSVILGFSMVGSDLRFSGGEESRPLLVDDGTGTDPDFG